MRFLCDQKGISPDEVMAFGNTENDVPLLRMAGFSYAVSNADEVAKKQPGPFALPMKKTV